MMAKRTECSCCSVAYKDNSLTSNIAMRYMPPRDAVIPQCNDTWRLTYSYLLCSLKMDIGLAYNRYAPLWVLIYMMIRRWHQSRLILSDLTRSSFIEKTVAGHLHAVLVWSIDEVACPVL